MYNKNSNNQGRSPNVVKVIFHTIRTAREKVLETLYQEENTCAILRLKGHDYRISVGS